MFIIERKSGTTWQPEIQRKTEFKAFIDARTKCMATGQTYRIVNHEREVECIITLDDCTRRFHTF
ncbi:hypothetical protein [Synechococcus sp. M16CYN]|uniref:hypothetical protein n=1 Tax=Synechococcus sp. M16CYN TaxID=3103139 RepID=UPI0033426E18